MCLGSCLATKRRPWILALHGQMALMIYALPRGCSLLIKLRSTDSLRLLNGRTAKKGIFRHAEYVVASWLVVDNIKKRELKPLCSHRNQYRLAFIFFFLLFSFFLQAWKLCEPTGFQIGGHHSLDDIRLLSNFSFFISTCSSTHQSTTTPRKG